MQPHHASPKPASRQQIYKEEEKRRGEVVEAQGKRYEKKASPATHQTE